MAEPDEHFCHSMSTITLTLQTAYPEGMWEIIEDKLSDALLEIGITGSLENNVTGNTVNFGKKDV